MVGSLQGTSQQIGKASMPHLDADAVTVLRTASYHLLPVYQYLYRCICLYSQEIRRKRVSYSLVAVTCHQFPTDLLTSARSKTRISSSHSHLTEKSLVFQFAVQKLNSTWNPEFSFRWWSAVASFCNESVACSVAPTKALCMLEPISTLAEVGKLWLSPAGAVCRCI